MYQKKEKGFTLIELLAIIVVLGIIAVIAVPTVKKLTEDAKKKAFINTARGIIKAGDLYYSRKDMLDEIDGDMIFTFPDNAEELELQGKLPDNGKITINEDGDIELVISNKDYCIIKGFTDKDIIITEDVDNCEINDENGDNTGNDGNEETGDDSDDTEKTLSDIGTSDNACVRSGTCTQTEIKAGIKVNIAVNDKQNYDFYVIADDGEKVTLIMSENLGDNVAWYAPGDRNYIGPTIAVEELKKRTDDWTNISKKTYTISGIGEDGTTRIYEDMTVTGRARLMSYEEATSSTIGCTTTEGSCPKWMYENLKNTGSNTDSVGNEKNGYWLSTADAVKDYLVWIVSHSKRVATTYTSYSLYGIRPVIELSK